MNPRPSPWQGDALPLRHFRLTNRQTILRRLAEPNLPRLRGVCPPLAVPVRRCRGAELNCRHRDFQSRALPPELPRRDANLQYSLIWRRVRVKAPSGAFGLLPHSNPHSQKGEGFVGLRDGGWWHSGLKIPAFAGMTGEGRGNRGSPGGLVALRVKDSRGNDGGVAGMTGGRGEVRGTGVGGTPGSRFPRSRE